MPKINIGDINLYYRLIDELNKSKPTLIFLHGGAGMADHSIYVPFWSSFSAIANVVFIDQRGCGKSDSGSPEKWNLTQHGKDVVAFCERHQIKSPIVAGVSWGGYIALSYAIQFPKHPSGLILCNTEARVSPDERYKAFLRIGSEMAANAVRAFDTDWNTLTNASYFKACLPYYAKRAYTPEELQGCIQNTKLWENYMRTQHTKFDLRKDIDTIECPVLYMAGENDPVHPAVCARETAALIGENCNLVIIEDTGDPVYRDKPQETIAYITEFIEMIAKESFFTKV